MTMDRRLSAEGRERALGATWLAPMMVALMLATPVAAQQAPAPAQQPAAAQPQPVPPQQPPAVQPLPAATRPGGDAQSNPSRTAASQRSALRSTAPVTVNFVNADIEAVTRAMAV